MVKSVLKGGTTDSGVDLHQQARIAKEGNDDILGGITNASSPTSILAIPQLERVDRKGVKEISNV
ncbi:hypothetical protein DPSP01_008078 [Paraphaeosphaeria sporulosa]